MRSTCLLFFLLLTFSVTATGAASPKVESYRLDVTFIPRQAAMLGYAAVAFDPAEPVPANSVFFLHGELEVDSIFQNGRPIEYTQKQVFYDYEYSLIATRVEMSLVSSSPADTVEVYYHGKFNPSRASSPSSYMRIDDDGVFLRAYGYSPWFPIFLEARQNGYSVDFTDVIIRAPSELTTVFVGHHLGDSIAGDTRISHWQSQNTQLYQAQCTSQRCNKMSVGPVHVYYWNDSTSIAVAEKIADFVVRVTEEFSRRYRGDATVEEYHIVEMPEYGDISSGNMSGLQVEYWHMFDQETWARRGLAHELVHPFVQPELNKADPLYAFMIESFPSFFHLPVLEQELGKDWYDAYFSRTEDRYLRYKATGKDRRDNDLPLEKPIDQIAENEIGDYKDCFILADRAILLLNYLRVKMGEKTFGDFGNELFDREALTGGEFKQLVTKHLPSAKDDIRIWLSTNDYPEHLRLASLK